ncbi:ABC transporter ATP-binding protein [Arcanobacterium ihumii]|uniref:ABC transporter ATP-binding protein n=1 Tax=Arcanobacterium ihumii TaxID=2138162 RepID=UPI000F528649|nr:ABC transporter ATP-binding protein [Arcanobacterium ihumii]
MSRFKTQPFPSPTESHHGLVVKNISIHRGSKPEPVVRNVSLSIEPGKVLSLVGPSGSGKTTLMQALAGLLNVSKGSIRIGGKDVTHHSIDRRPTGYVSQDPTLFENMNVWQNVAYGLDDPVMADHKYHDMIDIALAEMNISGIAEEKPSRLSGGQRQRVALARTLIRRPHLLLLDEPLAHVDDSVRKVIRKDILLHIRRLNISAVYVTHDVDEACAMGDALAIIRDGEIVQCARPQEVYEQPKSRFVAHFMGIPNIVDIKVDRTSTPYRVSLGKKFCAFPGNFDGEKSVLCIPSERIRILPSNEGETGTSVIRGHIIDRFYSRSFYAYEVETELGTIVVREVSHGLAKDIGQGVHLEIDYGWVVPYGS